MIRITRTENGQVRGIEAADPRITAFKNIPYAAPPVGENRWKAPKPAEDWEGIRDCSRFGNISIQPRPAMGDGLYEREWHVDPDLPMSEDCLNLNIWTPAATTEDRLPVLVWFFGGGLQSGYTAEMEFDGERIARRGIVVVTVNYRLGAFGYLAHPQLTADQPEAPANFGSLDQQAGLKWVQRNIEAFGGDPSKVTIAGQSAGGGSVLSQVACKENAGLFSRAVCMSAMLRDPYNDNSIGAITPLWKAEEMGQNFFDMLQVENLEEARALDASVIQEVYERYTRSAPIFFTVQDNVFAKGDPMDLYRRGECVDVVMMAGNTEDEFHAALPGRDEEDMKRYAKAVFGDKTEEFLSFEESHILTPGPGFGSGYASVAGTELAIRSIFEQKAEQGKEGYYYCFKPDIPGWDQVGTFHSSDLWFWFETLAKCWRPFVGHHYDLARKMCNYFCNFIKTGNPNGTDHDGNILPPWIPYTKTSPCVMNFTAKGPKSAIEEPGPYKRFLMDHIRAHMDAPASAEKAEMMAPVWESGENYREVFVLAEENSETKAPFLYAPEEVLQVESYDGTVVFQEGKDYEVKDGSLIRKEGSEMPLLDMNKLFFATYEEAWKDQKESTYEFDFGPIATSTGRYLYLGAVGHPEKITRGAVCVTYKSSETWNGYVPKNRLAELPRVSRKLENKEPISIVLFGDSISCGWDCTSKYRQQPNQPSWYQLLFHEMEEKWESPLTIHNTSLGGMDSDWAIRQAFNRVGRHNPDLVILAFGMNDRCPGSEYKEITQKIMDAIHESAPEAEFVLVATSLPNPELNTPPVYFASHQDEYAEAMEELCKPGIIVANVQGVQAEIQKRKRYIDLTGNLINHPNDYLTRVQAQVIAKTLGL